MKNNFDYKLVPYLGTLEDIR